jgi:hypothetical protein
MIENLSVEDVRKDLVFLRVSAACLAQQLGIETKQLPVLGKDRRELVDLAVYMGVGWNDLVSLCCQRIENLKERHHKCLMN